MNVYVLVTNAGEKILCEIVSHVPKGVSVGTVLKDNGYNYDEEVTVLDDTGYNYADPIKSRLIEYIFVRNSYQLIFTGQGVAQFPYDYEFSDTEFAIRVDSLMSIIKVKPEVKEKFEQEHSGVYIPPKKLILN